MAQESKAAANGKKSEAEKRKERKQKQKENQKNRRQLQVVREGSEKPVKAAEEEDIEIEYVSAPIEFDELLKTEQPDAMEEEEDAMGLGGLGFAAPKPSKQDDPYADLKKALERFAKAEDLLNGTYGADTDEEEDGDKEKAEAKKGKDSEDGDNSDDEDGKKELSKRQRKMLSRLKIAELKQLCERPDVVEVWDVTSPDPQLLVFLKAYRNTVAVPRHWSQKRKYLQGKRGIEKPPFKLPDFIEATGIGEMRNSYAEKEEAKKLKQKQRDRMAPKMGRMDIDYQVLHDAFFKHQSRPKLTPIGDIYYEGKEYEAKVEGLKPGFLSEALREALGMGEDTPPPWLINMQRYGPPPSYPDLKIPGLNAPIPPGASFGYQPGGWGKPPVDENGVPVYGDVFGSNTNDVDSDEEVDKLSRWGELDAEESEEEESEEEEEMGDEDLQDGTATGLMSGLVSGLASGIASSLPSGIETPDTMLNLRKSSESEAPKQLYQVLEQKQASVGANTIMGTDHVYVIPGQEGQAKKGEKKGKGVLQSTEIEVNLTPEEVEGLDEAQLKALYEEKVAEAKAQSRREDFSDLVAAKAAQQKRKIAQKAEDKAAKKAKDFKF